MRATAIIDEPIVLTLASATAAEPGAVLDDLSARRRHARRQQHWVMLFMSLGVLAAAGILQVTASGDVAVGGLIERPLPTLCMSRSLWNRPCPGCGLTRSFVHLMHGQWQSAWQMHRLGWLFLVAVMAQIPYRLAALRFPDRHVLGLVFPKVFGYVLIALLILNWLLLLVTNTAT